MIHRFTLVVLCALLAGASAKSVVLTDDNFEHLTQVGTGATTGDWLIKFYAPWCGHCQALAPDWIDLAELDAPEFSFNVGEVNIETEKMLVKRFAIDSLPTLIHFSKGQMWRYHGPPTRDGLRVFAAPQNDDEKNRSHVSLKEAGMGDPVPPPLNKYVVMMESAAAQFDKDLDEAVAMAETMQEVTAVIVSAGVLAGMLLACLFFGSAGFGYLFPLVLSLVFLAAGAFHTSPEHPQVLMVLKETAELLEFKKNATAIVFGTGAIAGLFLNGFIGGICCGASSKSKSKRD